MIPDYQTLMLPILRLSQGREVKLSDAVAQLANEFNLTAEEREQRFANGKQKVFYNRVHWAKHYLKESGLVRDIFRGIFIITEEGQRVLATGIERIDNAYLRQFPSFLEFQNRKGKMSNDGSKASCVMSDE